MRGLLSAGKRALLVVAAPVVVLGAIEFGIRLLQHFDALARYSGASLTVGDDAETAFNARLVRSADPLLGFEFAAGDPLLNSKGTRGPEFSTTAEPGVVRIAVLGDSVAFGIGVPTEDTFCSRLQGLLNGSSDGRRYEVLNFGVNGYGTTEELQLFRNRVEGLDPDLVLIAYVLNDPFPPSLMMEAVAGRMRTVARLDAVSRFSQLAAWVLLSRERMGSALEPYEGYAQMYSNPEVWEREAASFRGFSEIAKQQGLPVAVVIFPLLADYARHGLDKFHAQTHDLLEGLGMPYLDLTGAFRRQPWTSLQIRTSDDTHPNALGHRVAAESLREWLPVAVPTLFTAR